MNYPLMEWEPLEDYGPLEPNDLTALETELGYTLPHDYRAWLLKHNGGKIFPDYWRFAARWAGELSGLDQDLELFKLYGLRPNDKYSLDNRWRDMRDNIPHAALPIGDVVSPVILLMLDGPKRGTVCVWMTDTWPEQDQTRFEHLGIIAPSFDGFMQSLVHVPA